MISAEHKKHQKHAKLVRPGIGRYARNEVAILGTPCGNIKQLSRFLWETLDEFGPIGFVDADHQAADRQEIQSLNFTDKISYRRFDYAGQFNPFQIRPFFNQCELVLVNGNHFVADAQIVVLDPKKSLERKLERLSNPILLINKSGDQPVPAYLADLVKDVPVIEWENMGAIADFLKRWLQQRKPILKGLVLAGGRSVRMKVDKGSLEYHGVPQRKFVYQQLKDLGITSFVSCRSDQKSHMEADLPLLLDTYLDLGPMGALLTAFRSDPDAAWLAIACDLPYLDADTLKFLMEHRDLSKLATAFKSPYDEFPEPLITIWEPRSYPVLLNFLSQGYSCPRKVLINSDICLIEAPDAKQLSNVNHPEEYQEALRDLK